MIRFLLSIAISLVSAAVALLVIGGVLNGVEVHAAGFVVAVVVFTAAQALLAPFVFNLARKYAAAVLGGIGLVSTFLALFVASLFPNGVEISGVAGWVVSTLVVWVITALGTWILGVVIIKHWWQKRQQRKAATAKS